MRRAPIIALSGLTAALIATAAGIANAPASTQSAAYPRPTRTVTTTVTATQTQTVTQTATVTETAPGPTTTVTVPGPTVTVPGPTTTVTETVTASPSSTDTSSSTTPTPTPTPTTTAPSGWLCTTSDRQGRCGIAWNPDGPAWCGYTGITGIQGGTNGGCPYTDQNEWSPITGETQTLNANNPGDWQIVSNTPANPSGSVTTFPNTGAPFNEQPLSNFSTVVATVSETMPHNSATSGWAMMDNWFDNWKYEIMIQHDFTRNGACTYAAVATFGGQLWGLCTFGTSAGGAYAWKLAAPGSVAGSSGTANQGTITIDIKAMVDWLVAHGYMTPAPTITNLSDGWEICSTGGVPETFAVNSYSLTAN